jgi:hypothetical protein
VAALSISMAEPVQDAPFPLPSPLSAVWRRRFPALSARRGAAPPLPPLRLASRAHPFTGRHAALCPLRRSAAPLLYSPPAACSVTPLSPRALPSAMALLPSAAPSGAARLPRARSIPRALKSPRRRAAPSAAPRSHRTAPLLLLRAAPLLLRAVPPCRALRRHSAPTEQWRGDGRQVDPKSTVCTSKQELVFDSS